MKKLNSNNKNFDKIFDSFLFQRKTKIDTNFVSVTRIIKDVKKNGDKALLKYEKKFNQNNKITNSSKQVSKSIKQLDGFLIGGASKSSKNFIDIIKNFYK